MPLSSPVHIALLGCGTVGSGVAELLLTNAEAIETHGGAPFILDAIAVNDVQRERPASIPASMICGDALALIDDPSIDLIVECIGGTTVAREFVERALNKKKHVVTANKDLLALCGPHLRALAAENGVSLQYEAAVGGAIPIVRAISSSLAGEEILEVGGVLNGTTNFILSEMGDGKEYAAALAEAQARGFAESDPTSDVGGFDAAHKLTILIQLAFRRAVTSATIPRRGIEEIHPNDLWLARRAGFTLKLIACARAIDRGAHELAAAVMPAYVERSHPFAAPTGAHNCIRVVGRAAGSLIFAGYGAGSKPTASAVVGDIIGTLRMIAEDRPAVTRLEPAGTLSERAFALPRIIRLKSTLDARAAHDALRAAGFATTLFEHVPAVRSQPMPVLHDEPLYDALRAAGIEAASIIPLWEDLEDEQRDHAVRHPASLQTTLR